MGPRLAWFPSSCSVTIELDAIRRSICFIIWSPDVQIRGIQFLLKFTEKRCSVKQHRKGKCVHPMGDGRDCNICNHAVCPSHTHKQLKYWQNYYSRRRSRRRGSVCVQILLNAAFMFLTFCQSVGSWRQEHTHAHLTPPLMHIMNHICAYTITKQD